MPQVDLETLTDHKIACETTADPPESFWLSKDAEYDWFDKNAFYERNESLNGKSNTSQVLESSSKRHFTCIKSKPSILGLPKTQKTNFTAKRGKSQGKNVIRLFPRKRTNSMNKPANQLVEPSSPNVSCIGRVRSKRKNRKRVEPERKERKARFKNKGICKKFLSMFRTNKPVVSSEKLVNEPDQWRVNKVETVRTGVEPVPAGLGQMKRFASGRKSSADVDELVV